MEFLICILQKKEKKKTNKKSLISLHDGISYYYYLNLINYYNGHVRKIKYENKNFTFHWHISPIDMRKANKVVMD